MIKCISGRFGANNLMMFVHILEFFRIFIVLSGLSRCGYVIEWNLRQFCNTLRQYVEGDRYKKQITQLRTTITHQFSILCNLLYATSTRIISITVGEKLCFAFIYSLQYDTSYLAKLFRWPKCSDFWSKIPKCEIKIDL